MPICKHCKKAFDWGRDDDGWKPLVPIDAHDGLDRLYRDQDDVLRAHHSLVCVERNHPAVRIKRLDRKVSAAVATQIETAEKAEVERKAKKTLGEDLAPRSFSLFKRKRKFTSPDADGVITNAE